MQCNPPFFSSWFIVISSLGIGIAASASIMGLNHWAHTRHESALSLVEVTQELTMQRALEWEAIAKQTVENETRQELVKAQQNISELLTNLTNTRSSENSEFNTSRNLYNAYNAALDEQLQLIDAGQLEQAAVLEKEKIDPIFEQISDELAQLSDHYKQQAFSVALLSNLGTLASLLLASGTIGGLFWRSSAKIIRQNNHLNETLQQLTKTQAQLVQQEKMSSLGQMVAGVAHEINNPVSFIQGNLEHIEEYAHDLIDLLQLYEKHYPITDAEIQRQAEKIEIGFIKEDLEKALSSMKMGADRLQKIVMSLRTFSRTDETGCKAVDIHEGIESTLMILQHRLKAQSDRPAIEIFKDFDSLPLIECYAGQLNQVFMNILANAIDALDTKIKKLPSDDNTPQIKIRTETQTTQIIISMTDNGMGIPPKIKHRIFDPFFTTKPIGKGTGMGMAISYQLITEKHNGKIECVSHEGVGTEFIIELPIRLFPSNKK